MSLVYKKSGLIYIFIIFLSLISTLNIKVRGDLLNENNNSENNLFRSKSIEDDTPYILDTGDVIFIKFKGLDLFTNNYSVSLEGEIFLPELDAIYVRGLTINELRKLLTQEYKSYIIDPNIDINLINPRDLKISVMGEVNKPGLYNLRINSRSLSSLSNNEPLIENPVTLSSVYNVPRVFDALQKVEGITRNANLQNVIVKRNNASSRGGGIIQTNLDILALIKDGDQTQNITLRDGDSIVVPKSRLPIAEQFLEINKTNIAPSQIRIYVNGNVENSGTFVLRQNTSLYEAIASAGGKLDASGKINLVRFNDQGKTEIKKFAFNQNFQKGSQNNPYLLDGDIITVNKNILGKVSATLDAVGSPFFKSYAIYNLLENSF